MMKSIKAALLAAIYFTLLTTASAAFELGDKLTFNPNIYTRYDKTKLEETSRTANSDFYAIQFNAPLSLDIYDNFSLKADLFYNKNKDASAKINFQTAAVIYRNCNFLVKAGRQSYTRNNKESIIYYGPRYEIDGKAPTALDGIRATAKLGLFFYDFIIAREALSPYGDGDNYKIYGGSVGIGLMDFTALEAFAYTSNNDISDTNIFGAVLSVYADENFKAYLTGATSKKITKTIYFNKSVNEEKKGYLLNFNMSFTNNSSRIKRLYKLRAVLTDNKTKDNEGFSAISSGGYYGYIFSSQNIYNNSGNRTDIANYKIYNASIEYSLNDFPPLSFTADLYLYESMKYLPRGDHRAYEVDLSLKYTATNFEFAVIYGLYGTNAMPDNAVEGNVKNNTNKFGFYGKIFL